MTADLTKPDAGLGGLNETFQNNSGQQGMGAKRKPARNFEDVLQAMGGVGKYQLLQCFMTTTMVSSMVFNITRYVFISHESDHVCSPANNETELFHDLSIPANETHLYRAQYNDSCAIDIQKINTSGVWKSFKSVGCNYGYDYVDGRDYSFVTEWDLVCDETGISELAQTVIALGTFVGGLTIIPMADKIGRSKTIAFSFVFTSGFEFATAYAPNMASLIVLRFFSGVVVTGMSCSYFIMVEQFVSKHRVFYSAFTGSMYAASAVLLSWLGYALRNSGWRQFQIYSTIMTLLPLLFLYFINESPAWLHSVGNKKDAEKLVRLACKTNGVHYDGRVKETFDEWFESSQNETKDAVDKNDNKVKSSSMIDIFRHGHLLKILAITWFSCFSNELAYTGLTLTASSLVGSFYLNVGILQFVGIPASMFNVLLLKYKGRRFLIISMTLITALCLLISTVVDQVDIDKDLAGKISLTFFVLGKFANNAGYNTLFMYIPETFPTSVRSSGTGLATSGIAAAGSLAPYLLPLRKVASWAPGTAFVVCCFLTAVMFSWLPETKDKQLSDSLELESETTGEENGSSTRNILPRFNEIKSNDDDKRH